MKLTEQDFTIRNSRSCAGVNGTAWSADVYIRGRKAFSVRQSGTGGEASFTVYDSKLYEAARKYAGEREPYVIDGISVPADLEMFISQMADRKEHEARLKRYCRTETVFRLPGDPDGEYRRLKAKCTADLKKRLLEKYPEAEIVNDRYSGGKNRGGK